jgi:hypothetical protein
MAQSQRRFTSQKLARSGVSLARVKKFTWKKSLQGNHRQTSQIKTTAPDFALLAKKKAGCLIQSEP